MRTHAFGAHHLCQLVLPEHEDAAARRHRDDLERRDAAPTTAAVRRTTWRKAALEALAFTLAKEVKKRGIHVNVVAPGLVETEMGRRLMKATAGVDDLRTLDAAMPFGRVCQPEDVANTVRWLRLGARVLHHR